MSAKENKKLVRRAWKAWGELDGDPSKVPALYDMYYTSDFVLHRLASGDRSRDQQVQSDMELVSAFPDSSYEIDDILAEGDRVALRMTWNGTHSGTFLGKPATGNHIAVKGEQIYRIRRGKVSEAWAMWDIQGMMTQIEAIPTAPKK